MNVCSSSLFKWKKNICLTSYVRICVKYSPKGFVQIYSIVGVFYSFQRRNEAFVQLVAFAIFQTCCLSFSQLLKSRNGAEIFWSWCRRQPVYLFLRAHCVQQPVTFILFYWISVFCGVSHFLTFRIIRRFVHVRYVAHGRSLIICPQICRLSHSTSLIAGTTFSVVITAFADFLWATDWTEEKKKTNRNLSQIRCSACVCENLQAINKTVGYSLFCIGFFGSTYFIHPHIRYRLPTAGEDQLSCLIFLFKNIEKPDCVVNMFV